MKFSDSGFMICPQCGINNDEEPIITTQGDHYNCKNCNFNWIEEIELVPGANQ